MQEIGKRPWNRVVLYLSGAACVVTLILVGFVHEPTPAMTLKDYSADLAIHMTLRDFPAARADIKEILEHDPDNLHALLMLAYIQDNSGETEHALELYKKGLSLAWKYPDMEDEIYDSLSMLALKAGHREEARDYARQKIRVFGENVLSRLIIALSFFSKNDDRDLANDDKYFEENLDQALEMGISSPAWKLELGSLFEDKETLQRLYFRSVLERARCELRYSGMIWP
jgi:tetratricopeptide (TPR) repeat protein